jgi:mercuric reductase
VRREGTETVVTARVGGEERTVRSAALLVATGRLPNTADLNLEAAGVRTDRRGAIVVDEMLRTSNPAVYAVGDVTSLPQFVYVAAAAGGLAVKNALQGAGRPFDLRAVPRVTFTSPQLAAVGLSEEQARAQGYRPMVSELPVAYIPRAIVNRDTRGTVRLIADEATERLLGAQILAPQGAELLAEATLAVRLGLTISDITDTMHAYLTMTEGLKLAAQGFRKDVARLSCCAA